MSSVTCLIKMNVNIILKQKGQGAPSSISYKGKEQPSVLRGYYSWHVTSKIVLWELECESINTVNNSTDL